MFNLNTRLSWCACGANETKTKNKTFFHCFRFGLNSQTRCRQKIQFFFPFRNWKKIPIVLFVNKTGSISVFHSSFDYPPTLNRLKENKRTNDHFHIGFSISEDSCHETHAMARITLKRKISKKKHNFSTRNQVSRWKRKRNAHTHTHTEKENFNASDDGLTLSNIKGRRNEIDGVYIAVMHTDYSNTCFK